MVARSRRPATRAGATVAGLGPPAASSTAVTEVLVDLDLTAVPSDLRTWAS